MGTWWRADSPDTRLSGYLETTVTAQPGYNWKIHIDGALGDIEVGYDSGVTLFGETSQGLLTLHHAAPIRNLSSSSLRSEKTTSEWAGYQLIKGGHLPLGELFESASFQIPFAIDWLGSSPLNAHSKATRMPKDRSKYEWEVIETAELENGLTLRAGIGQSSLLSGRGLKQEYEWLGSYTLTQSSGFTLEEAMHNAYGVSQLQSLAFGTRMESFGFHLTQLNPSSQYQQIQIIDPYPPAGSDWNGICPFIDTSEVDFEEFMRSWLKLRGQASLVDAAIPSFTSEQGAVQLKFLAQCATLETIAKFNWAQPSLKNSDSKILEALKVQEIRERDISMVRNQLQQRRWPLEKKLITAASLLGPESSEQLLGDIQAWAFLVMRLRNALTHGLSLPGNLDENIEFVIEAQQSLEVVLQLAILRQIGYRNSLSGHDGELLWSGSKITASHNNSSLFKEAKSLSRRSGQWKTWRALVGG